MIGQVIGEFVLWQYLFVYLEVILWVYNKYGNCDNKFKVCIKILVKVLGVEKYCELIEVEFVEFKDGLMMFIEEEVVCIQGCFIELVYWDDVDNGVLDKVLQENCVFNCWYYINICVYKCDGYCSVMLMLKKIGCIFGDVSDEQLEMIVELVDCYSFGELCNIYQQNMVLFDVVIDDLFELWEKLDVLGMVIFNLGLFIDIVVCFGGDLCVLVNVKFVLVVEGIQCCFDDMDYVYDLGLLDINIFGCMNVCGYYYIGYIGIFGVDKKGKEFYQIMFGGCGDKLLCIGEKMGFFFEFYEVIDVIEKIINVYVDKWLENELFIDIYECIGMELFKEQVYG